MGSAGKADAEQGGGDQPHERRGCGLRARPGVGASAQGTRGQPCSSTIMSGQAVADAAGLLALQGHWGPTSTELGGRRHPPAISAVANGVQINYGALAVHAG